MANDTIQVPREVLESMRKDVVTLQMAIDADNWHPDWEKVASRVRASIDALLAAPAVAPTTRSSMLAEDAASYGGDWPQSLGTTYRYHDAVPPVSPPVPINLEALKDKVLELLVPRWMNVDHADDAYRRALKDAAALIEQAGKGNTK